MIRGYDQWKTQYPPEYDEPCMPMDELEKELSNLGSSKNRDCWAVPFNGKDADLEPEGCTGIEGLRYPNEDDVEILVGGHKTVVPVNQENVWNMPDEDVEEWMDICESIVCGCFPEPGHEGEWTGEDWCMSFHDSLIVKWVIDDDMEYDVEATAKLIFEKAVELVESVYEPIWKQLDEMINEVYREAIEKYGE